MKFTRHRTAIIAATAAASLAAATGGSIAAASGTPSHRAGNSYGYSSWNGPLLGSSHGERFLRSGQTARLGRLGHFTFSATCSKVGGQNQVSFDVVANTTAGLDGNPPAPAGQSVNIHTNSDSLDGKNPGEFDQVGSASSSTEIAADGQEVDVFYNDGVNWPAMGGAPAHDCFAGYTGILG
jgi:hypothetical protein